MPPGSEIQGNRLIETETGRLTGAEIALRSQWIVRNLPYYFMIGRSGVAELVKELQSDADGLFYIRHNYVSATLRFQLEHDAVAFRLRHDDDLIIC